MEPIKIIKACRSCANLIPHHTCNIGKCKLSKTFKHPHIKNGVHFADTCERWKVGKKWTG